MTVGLLGGSFNPVHIGHMIVAQYIAEFGGVDCVWMVLSPRNPLKDPAELIDDRHRLAMLRIATGASERISVSDVELGLPRPAYTIDTLKALAAMYPEHDFRWITGSDNLLEIHRWKSWREILRDFGMIVYPRPGYAVTGELPAGVSMVEAPQVDISSTMLRRDIARGAWLNYFMPPGVAEYIRENRLYISQP